MGGYKIESVPEQKSRTYNIRDSKQKPQICRESSWSNGLLLRYRSSVIIF